MNSKPVYFRAQMAALESGPWNISYVSGANTLMPVATPLFEIENLHVQTSSHGANQPIQILKGVTLSVMPGEIHALMGPNGSGKSTLAATLLGSPEYEITEGLIRLRGDDITDWATDVRAKAGLFLAFQHPEEFPGVSVLNFVHQALSARRGIETSVLELRKDIERWMERLEMNPAFMQRFLNDGFSTGEKKRNEILQMALLEPEMAVLDETDSGLDAAALRTVARCIHEIHASRPQLGTLFITHHQQLLHYLEPDVMHVLIDGKIVETGRPELAKRLETESYDGFQ